MRNTFPRDLKLSEDRSKTCGWHAKRIMKKSCLRPINGWDIAACSPSWLIAVSTGQHLPKRSTLETHVSSCYNGSSHALHNCFHHGTG